MAKYRENLKWVSQWRSQESIVCPKLWESHETHLNINKESLLSENQVYADSAQNFMDYAITMAKRWQSV